MLTEAMMTNALLIIKDKLIIEFLQCEEQLSTVSCVFRKSYTLHVEYIDLKFGLMMVYIPPGRLA